MKKYRFVSITAVVLFGFAVVFSIASAHVVVRPASVGIGAFQTFTMGVPSEKNSSTVEVRLLIPDGLHYVSPNVKPGWNIVVKKNGTSSDATVTEIAWIGGKIPAGERDDFVFSAEVPSSATTLQWKAYQIYSDGSVVSWDKSSSEQATDAMGKADFSTSGPYSETTIIDDLTTATSSHTISTPTLLSSVALVISLIALYGGFRKRTETTSTTN